MNSISEDEHVFWKLRNIRDTYWEEYIATRPVYTPSFMSRIYTYHVEHLHTFDVAIDIGSGAGQAAAALASRFSTTIASDNDAASLAFMKYRLSHIPRNKLFYSLTSGEDVLQHHRPGSMDMVVAAECFPVMDMQYVLRNFHELLKPRGTMAIWVYGRAHFVKESATGPSTPNINCDQHATSSETALPYDNNMCQNLLDRIMDCNFRPIVSNNGPERQKSWKRAADSLASWLEDVEFDERQWCDVRRHKWNPHFEPAFFGQGACDFDIEPRSRVTATEICTEETDETFWVTEWNVEEVGRFVRASFPKPEDTKSDDQEMEKLFSDLRTAMGGSKVKRRLSWGVVLILASKKSPIR